MRFLAVPTCLLLLVCPPGVTAQSATPAPSSAEKAANLIAQAQSLFRTQELPERAKLFEEAANLLPAGDPRASRALRSAAEVNYQLHKTTRAMQLLERSADLAAGRGSATEAADTYVAALLVALELNARASARRFIDRAIALTSSPAMPEVDRQRILRRISQPAESIGYNRIPARKRGEQ